MALEFTDDDELSGVESFEVETPSGATLRVTDAREKEYYERLRDKIMGSYDFTDPNDYVDLDHILGLELSVWRIQGQLNLSLDAHSRPLSSMDITRLSKTLTDNKAALAKAKDALGLSKVARDKANDGESVASYLENLRKRAHEFGIHRNNQVHKALGLMNEIGSVAGTWLRSNDFERAKLGYPAAEDVLRWIAQEAYPEYQKIDEEFRANGQRYWIGDV